MQHVDPEVLALWALGEDDLGSPADRAHLSGCAACRAEHDALARAAEVGREAGPLVAPPAEVWERVRAEVRADAGAPSAPPRPAAVPGTPDAPPVTTVVDLASRRRRTFVRAGAAAAAALVVGVAGGVVWERGRTPAPAPAPVAVASAALEPLPGWPGSTGTAVVEEDPDGVREVVVHVADGTVTGDAYREVWLLAADLSGMVSLGVLDDDEGTFPVPDGLDLEKYSVVDVSAEPYDGDPVHSGDSIVRGALDPA
ncbi:anti-sigma-K factor rskA [Isoptericola jiangsuensis]|uniref:Anti-sigma-K factor rskA n=1 Tax=Isoptericola jiangsuensis TaxID=548579 RepID=A0A2A9EXN4_9MICO|nr:anti-sigma-K factor rskA [Isoptericola jiangsuensis]